MGEGGVGSRFAAALLKIFRVPQRRPLRAAVPDPRSDDSRCLTWKVSVRARGRARRLLPARPQAFAPLRPGRDPPARGAGEASASLPLLSPHRLAAASAFLPRLVFLPALACLLPSPQQARKFHPPFAFPGDYSPRSPRTPCTTLPTLAFFGSRAPAPNLSAMRSPSGRLPGGVSVSALLASRPAPPTTWGARLPSPRGRLPPLQPQVQRSGPNPFLPCPCCLQGLAFAR